MTSGGQNKRAREEVEKIINDLRYILLDDYYVENDNRHRRVVIQDEEGYEYDVQFGNIVKQKGKIRFIDKGNCKSLRNISLWLFKNKKEFNLCDENKYVSTKEKLWFHCLVPECGMDFDMSWTHVYGRGYGCPFCSGKRVSDKNRLSVAYPNIALEWDYGLNIDTPFDVSYGSRKKRWWICLNGHESYFATISHRTSGKGCPTCADEQKESLIATELKRWCKETFKDVDIEHKMFRNPETNKWLKCDIYIGKKETLNGVYVEIHGGQHYRLTSLWHKNKDDFMQSKNRDKIKKNFAKKNGTYIEVDLRKIKTTNEGIVYIKRILK